MDSTNGTAADNAGSGVTTDNGKTADRAQECADAAKSEAVAHDALIVAAKVEEAAPKIEEAIASLLHQDDAI